MGQTVAGAPGLTAARRRACVALACLMGFSLGFSEFVPLGMEQELADAFGVTLQQVGLLTSTFAVTYAVATPLLAVCTSRVPRRSLLVAYGLVFCAGNLVAAVAAHFAVLLVARVLIGLVSGALLAVVITYLPELVGEGRTSLWISVVYALFAVAMVVATSVGKLVAEYLAWPWMMWAALALAVATCAAVVAARPRTEVPGAESAGLRAQLGLLSEPAVLSGIAIFVFGVGSVYVFYGYATPYLQQVLSLDANATSATLMAYGVVCFFSNLLSGWLASRFGLPALRVTFVLQAMLLAGLWAAGGNAPLGVALALGVGLTMYLASVPCISMFLSTARRRHPGALTLASSLEPMSFNMGIAFGSLVGGAVVAGPGIAWAGIVGACFSLVAEALVCLTLRLER